MELLHSGKVRDVYADGDDLILVASDRVSVYDVVLPTPIPDKGKILTQLSLWWFEQLADVVPNHVISATDVPAEWAGRAIRCRRLDMVQVECIARGYLTGSGLKEYQRDGHRLAASRCRPAWSRADRLPEPIFTPTTKAPARRARRVHHVRRRGRPGGHGHRRGAAPHHARGLPPRRRRSPRRRGIIIADTKIEFGRAPDGTLVLADEVLTPDSSRFWPADEWEPGRPQYAFDKQFVRDWAAGTGWDKTPPGPRSPTTSSRPPGPATSRRTSASPVPPGRHDHPWRAGCRTGEAEREDIHVYAVTIPEPGGPEVLTWAEVPDPDAGPRRGAHRHRRERRQPGRPAAAGRLLPTAAGRAALPRPRVLRPRRRRRRRRHRWQPGDEVCALLGGGGYAQRVAVPAAHCLPVPAGVSVEDAAALPEVACTVWSNVFDLARLQRSTPSSSTAAAAASAPSPSSSPPPTAPASSPPPARPSTGPARARRRGHHRLHRARTSSPPSTWPPPAAAPT